MPPVKSKSVLLQKLGDRAAKAFEAHRHDETTHDVGGELPAGVNGIARLVKCGFGTVQSGKQNAGQLFFRAEGRIVEPATFTDPAGNVHRVAGRITSVMETCCDTPSQSRKTVDDHLAQVMLTCRRIGIPTEDAADWGEMEERMKMACEEQVPFSFRTWKGDKAMEGPYKDREPRVNHVWDSLPEGIEPAEVHTNGEVNASGMDDGGEEVTEEPAKPPVKPQSKAAPPAKIPITKTSSSGNGKKPPLKAPPKAAESEPEPVQQEFNEFGDLDSLAEKAEAGDEEAQNQLVEVAHNAGIDDEQLSQIESFQDLVNMLTGGDGATPAEAEPETQDDGTWPPQKGLCFRFHPMVVNKMTKKSSPSKEAVECEVTAVQQSVQTVTLKNLEDGGKTIYKGISWNDLVR